MTDPRLFSIGYATKTYDVFLEQLVGYGINAVADVRSVPYSKAFEDYRQEKLMLSLPAAGINYVFMGEELGPRSADPAHYDATGQVQFDRLKESELFNRGVERLKQGLEKDYRIALMCAEKDPANGHRSLLIGYYLAREHELELNHICHAGNLETQQELERRLVDLEGCSTDMFSDAEQLQELAYQQRIRATSYRRK